ncbi:MAG: cation:proton antiporter [Proteobacteria bacterium]|nr:cation:proton antiporter [Candidatus Enterousia scatequi]
MMTSILIFLSIMFVVVCVMNHAKIGVLIAFLLAGILSGKYGFGLFELNNIWTTLGDIGILFLWFMIGLEISMSRMWAMRRTLISFGGAQVLMVAIMLFPILFDITSWGVIGCLMISLMLAMSSTSQDLPTLTRRNQLNTYVGRQSFSILLFQDLVAIALMAAFPVVAGKTLDLGATLIDISVLTILLVGGAIIIGRAILNPLLRMVARFKSREAMLLAVLLNIFFWAWVISLTGLPMELGGFLAGILLSETIFRHQISAEITPYTLLFLAMFFVALGMELNIPFLASRWYFILVGLIGLVGIKFAAIFMVARVRRLKIQDAAFIGVLLAQGSEFALLMLQMMRNSGIDLIPLHHQEILIAIIVLSMITSPLILWIYDRMYRTGRLGNKKQIADLHLMDIPKPSVVICGFGRVGQIVARILSAKNISYIAIDTDVNAVMVGREMGLNCAYGDVKSIAVLRSFGLNPRNTRAVVIALDNSETAHNAVLSVKAIAPNVKIYARARNLYDSREMLKSGVTEAFPETIESSFWLVWGVFKRLGYSREEVRDLLHDMRENNYEKLQEIPLRG